MAYIDDELEYLFARLESLVEKKRWWSRRGISVETYRQIEHRELYIRHRQRKNLHRRTPEEL